MRAGSMAFENLVTGRRSITCSSLYIRNLYSDGEVLLSTVNIMCRCIN
jgi:hypothetical protein